ncbi:hypothetical protein D9V30_05265 [Mycetocola reblochoni]|uniref:Uncharacterized protein n=1 Tax=Mycetocola reblochoni TaxID=331618 RepID=A0A3L6ZQ87_9MICO|nr:hypothetical protein [Mycetocola reblochoni]RLP70076.1 hypothetical protein D9V30_05265 [Mycetocola reblochoni]
MGRGSAWTALGGPRRGPAAPTSAALQGAPGGGEPSPSERGDVPGWVLITLMTTALVVAIWALAAPALTALFEQAISRVSEL